MKQSPMFTSQPFTSICIVARTHAFIGSAQKKSVWDLHIWWVRTNVTSCRFPLKESGLLCDLREKQPTVQPSPGFLWLLSMSSWISAPCEPPHHSVRMRSLDAANSTAQPELLSESWSHSLRHWGHGIWPLRKEVEPTGNPEKKNKHAESV